VSLISLGYRCSVGLLGLSLLAQGQSGQTDTIHVEPPTSREGIRVSLKPSASVPSSPEAAALLHDLVIANGVDMEPTTPWHVAFTYDEFDGDGDNVHSGTVEEFYVGATKYRRIIKTDEFSQTEVATGAELYRSGNQDWPPIAVLQAIDESLSPLYRATGGIEGSPDKLDWSVGKSKLSCVVLRNGRILSDNGLPKFCYEPGSTILRYTRGRGWDETAYNDIFQLEQRYFAHQIEVTHSGKPFLKIHLSKVENLSQLDNSLFSPPRDGSGPVTGPVKVPGALLIRLPESVSSPPSFPKGVRGTVTITFLVDKKGHVKKATATDGPEELRKPAEKAVKKTRFRPFQILENQSRLRAP